MTDNKLNVPQEVSAKSVVLFTRAYIFFWGGGGGGNKNKEKKN